MTKLFQSGRVSNGIFPTRVYQGRVIAGKNILLRPLLVRAKDESIVLEGLAAINTTVVAPITEYQS